MSDIIIQADGSMIGFLPITERAELWFEANVNSEPWQWLGRMLWADWRMARDVLAALDETDFIIKERS